MKYAIVLLAAIVVSASAWPTKGGFEQMPVQSQSTAELKTMPQQVEELPAVQQPLQKLFTEARKTIAPHFERLQHQMPVKGHLYESAPLKQRTTTYHAAPLHSTYRAPIKANYHQLESFQAPVESVQAPVQTLAAPIKGNYQAPVVESVQAPVQTVAAPVKGSYQAPVKGINYQQLESVQAPVESVQAPVQTLAAPIKGSNYQQLESVQAPLPTLAAPIKGNYQAPVVESVQAPVQSTVQAESVQAPIQRTKGGFVHQPAELMQQTQTLAAPIKGQNFVQQPAAVESVQAPVVAAPVKESFVPQPAAVETQVEATQAPVEQLAAPIKGSYQAPVTQYHAPLETQAPLVNKGQSI